MDVEYKGQHSIVFFKDTGNGYSKRHSWTDFHMIPTVRPYVVLGSPSISQVVIAGTSKRVDITDYKPGGLTFGGRTGTWEFYIDHTKWPDWVDAKSTIRDYIHAGTFLINLTDDPYVLYQGILTISGYVAGESYSKITIQYDLMAETVLLDDPIDFWDFGKYILPDPKWIDTNGDGKIDGLDINGDGSPDIPIIEDGEGKTGIDIDGDGNVDVEVDPSNPADPKWIDVDGDGIPDGIDTSGDGNPDLIPEKIDIDGDGTPDGYDFDGDGVIDVPLTPKDPDGESTFVIGAYYPLQFIHQDGSKSSMYGFASVDKSTGLLGVYDLYTIYEDDKVTTNL